MLQVTAEENIILPEISAVSTHVGYDNNAFEDGCKKEDKVKEEYKINVNKKTYHTELFLNNKCIFHFMIINHVMLCINY